MLEHSSQKNLTISCKNEYGPLQTVIVVPPTFMEIKEVINEIQAQFKNENINKKIAEKQHTQFVHSLEAEGVTVISLETNPNLNEQVFTRDIGFTIGDQLLIANMARKVRKPETTVLTRFLADNQIAYRKLLSSPIEGGDIIVDNKKIWVGISDRTTIYACRELQNIFPDYQVTPITLRDDILHLDCTFNVLNENTALIYSQGIDQKSYQLLKATYNLINISDEEQFRLGTNVFSIGNKKIISLPENKRVNEELRNAGFTVIEVPFSEVIKSGGSFRCCTLPLLRS